ncbi:hypothetical protein J2X31_002512 [Flavobacterium arsenatis]|uniref:Uncharacterized protein n=1 Tax=Flavobacterium arsenatis TaxID=1484332 RepID=A0ABU1TRJ4_9FLAO|nr:hypothetical protein [Flavobacterium arsenatis]MDR6968489.1 hypothetical protein [Flavobacterium arsenatis]
METKKTSTSEKGHAKNIANGLLLITHIEDMSETYNPSNPNLQLVKLQELHTEASKEQSKVNTSLSPYSLAVDQREEIFAPLSKKLTKLKKAYKSTLDVSTAQVEDFMTISRKIKGTSKPAKINENDTSEEKKQHSTSQLSYDQRTNNYEILISLLENTPNYKPNETEYQVDTLKNEREEMLKLTKNVGKTFVPLNNARSSRNNIMYITKDNYVETFTKAKDYLATILDTKSSQYKAIAKINFKKP